MMKLREALNLKRSPVVLGIFHNTDELFRACAVLTDFGYPKESARISRIETIMPSTRSGILETMSRHLTTKKLIVVLAIVSAVTIGGVVLAEMPKTALAYLPESLLTVILSLLFFSAGSLTCLLVGFLIWALIQPLLASEKSESSKSGKKQSMATSFKGKITLRIKPRNSIDASDIAQAWSEIGGRVVSN